MTPLISSLPEQPVKGYWFPTFDNAVFSTTNIDQMTVGMGPHYWSGKLRTSLPSTIRVYASIGQSKLFHFSQWGDIDYSAESYWLLYNSKGEAILGGDSSGTHGIGLYRTLPLAYLDKYTLVVPYNGYYRINGQPGNIITTLEFDSRTPDFAPPYLQHFRVLSDGWLSNYMIGGSLNEVEFDVLDDASAIVSVSLFTKPYSESVDYQRVPLDVVGTKYSARIPDLAADDFVSMKLVAVDAAGNSLTTEWDIAFYYEATPGVPVADAGQDQKVTVEYGSDTATVTLDGSVSYDTDGSVVSYLWKEGEAILGSAAVIEATLSIETHDISLTVTDNDGLSSSDTTQVVIESAKVVPVADAGGDQQVEAEYGSETVAVTLNGSGSYDPDGSIVSYLWKEGNVTVGNSAVIEATLSVGTHTITLTVTDNDGLSSSDTMQVVVTQEALSDKNIYMSRTSR
jgi:hypothetical protein